VISPELEAKWDERIEQMETSSDAQMAGVADCLKDIATSWIESENGTDEEFIEFMKVCAGEMVEAAQEMIRDLDAILTSNPADIAPAVKPEATAIFDVSDCTITVNGQQWQMNRELLRQQAAAVGRIIEDARKFPTLGSVKAADMTLLEGVWEALHRLLDVME